MIPITRYLIYCTVLVLFFLLSTSAFSRGIIIGFDSSVVSIFKHKNAEEIKLLAEDVSTKYDKVIIHLGRKYPFTKSYFSDSTSRTNLKNFCELLSLRNIKVYMWILDSYGSENFDKLYIEHENIIDDATERLNDYKISYNGIVVDMEWINYPEGKNNDNYINILKYLRKKLGNKELLAFTPIIESNR